MHGYLNIARSFPRALNTCDFDVPSAMPSIGGDFLMVEALDVVKHEHFAASRRELSNRAVEVETLVRKAGAGHRFWSALNVDAAGQLGHLSAPAAHVVQTQIDREPVQPRPDRRVPPKAIELAVRLQKDLLEQILAFGGRSTDPRCQRIQAGRVLSIQLLECDPRPPSAGFGSARSMSHG